MIKQTTLVAAALLAFAGPAAADTLYVAGPPPAAPGHPMHLGAYHRATQVGDLVHIVINFNGSANNSDAATTANTYSNTLNSGSGLFNLPLLRLGGGIGASSTTGLAKTQTIVQTFSSSMTAVVTSVLPSGAMEVAGDQKLTINGVPQALIHPRPWTPGLDGGSQPFRLAQWAGAWAHVSFGRFADHPQITVGYATE